MTDRELMQQWLQPGAIVPVDMNTVRILLDALRERLAQPEQQPLRPDYRDWDYQDQLDAQEKPEQSPLDRMAENARELGLDYEPVQEPVAVHQFRVQGCSDWYDGYPDYSDGTNAYETRTLYTTPPRREWQGLTDEEIKMLPQWFPSHETAAVMPLIRTIEAKLKERNNG